MDWVEKQTRGFGQEVTSTCAPCTFVSSSIAHNEGEARLSRPNRGKREKGGFYVAQPA